MIRLAAMALVLVLAPPAAAQSCPPRTQWPAPTWNSRVAQTSTARSAQIAALETYAFTLQGEDHERLGIRTDGVLIIKDGSLLYERYARTFDRSHRHIAWSVAKSVVDVMAGAAVHAGMLDLDRPACEYLSRLRGSDVCTSQARHVLELGTGLEWTETYEGSDYASSSVLAMLYGEGRFDMAGFTARHRAFGRPGDSWVYSTGGVTLMCGVLGAAVPPGQRDSYPWDLVFGPLGMTATTFERDPTGTFVGGSHIWATPRDLARIGYLYLNDGCWNGQRLLPTGWVAESTSPNPGFLNSRPEWGGNVVPGRLWWLNTAVPGIKDDLSHPDVPPDAYLALGHWGQMVAVIPSLDLVVVRVADDREDDVFDRNTFLSLAMAVAEGM